MTVKPDNEGYAERRAVHIPLSLDVIDGLGWSAFAEIAERAQLAALRAGWPDWTTVSERLVWRHCRSDFYGQIIATFEVVQ